MTNMATDGKDKFNSHVSENEEAQVNQENDIYDHTHEEERVEDVSISSIKSPHSAHKTSNNDKCQDVK